MVPGCSPILATTHNTAPRRCNRN